MWTPAYIRAYKWAKSIDLGYETGGDHEKKKEKNGVEEMREAQCDRKTEKRPLDMCKRYGSGQGDGEKRWKENKNKSYLKMS